MPLDLRRCLERLRDGLRTPVALRDGWWALGRCHDSREVHLVVWQSRPDPKQVLEEVIPLLSETRAAVVALEEMAERKQLGEFGGQIGDVADNIASRIRNLEAYVGGRPSVFAPRSEAHDETADEEE